MQRAILIQAVTDIPSAEPRGGRSILWKTLAGGESDVIQNRFRRAAILVFILAILLRLGLTAVNMEANDNHAEVIRIMAYENRLPGKEDAWEGFQPKLYHATVAAIWRALPTNSYPILIRVAQMVSCLAGIMTLIVVRRFLRRSDISEKARLLSFSLVAFNPGLIGINSQATNDSFVILFASVCLYYGSVFFESGNRRAFAWMTASAVLAALSKGNGLVLFPAILVTFAVALLYPRVRNTLTKKHIALNLGVFLIVFLALVPSFGPYLENYRRYGSPFVTNMEEARLPSLIEKTYEGRPGVTSIVDSYLTFRWLDMLRNPVITNDATDYPLHRTSLWSQIFGGTHFVQFAAWPPSWAPSIQFVRHLGRGIFVFALLPTVVLLAGMMRSNFNIFQSVLGNGENRRLRLGDWLLHLSAFGYLTFVILYTLKYRDFSTMKAIFLFPGLLGFLMFFSRECHRWHVDLSEWKMLRRCSEFALVILLALYALDVSSLIFQLR